MKSEESSTQTSTTIQSMGWIFKLLIPVAILALAVFFFMVMVKTKPKAPQKPLEPRALQVHVETVHQTDVVAVLDQIQGPVIPAQDVTLSPQVTGLVSVLDAHFVPGGTVAKGQTLLRIDAEDYELVLQQRQSDVAAARLNLELEMGQQDIARQEYELLGEEISKQDRALVLREPHLAQAQASLDAALAAVAKAELDLSRCFIRAPFNAVIRSRSVDVGMRVSPGTTLATLAGTDEYWIEASVPVGKLQWIDIPREGQPVGSLVRIYDAWAWGPGRYREGRVFRLLSDTEDEGLLARLLVSVKDPLALLPENQGKPALLLGAKVDVEIQGESLESVVPIPRPWLRDGDYVWILDQDNTLKIQPVETSFRGRETVCVTHGLHDGQQVVVTDIGAPVAGMALKVMTGADAVLDGEGD